MPVPVCGSRCAREGASSEAEVNLRARRNPLEGGVSPRARWNPLEGGVSPRARRNLLEGDFAWATPVGRGGHRSVGHALCVRLRKRCVLLLFFAGFKQDSPGFLGDPQGCPRQEVNVKIPVCPTHPTWEEWEVKAQGWKLATLCKRLRWRHSQLFVRSMPIW
jgi:hypothetical protein